MIKQYTCSLLIIIAYYTNQLFYWFLYYFGPVYFVYSYSNGKIKNVTLQFYLSFFNSYFNTYNNYFYKIITHNNTFYYSQEDIISAYPKSNDFYPLKKLQRKQITLLNAGKVIEFDLKHVDNYVLPMITHNKKYNTMMNPKLFFDIFGLTVTHIKAVCFNPFNIETKIIHCVNLTDFYHNIDVL